MNEKPLANRVAVITGGASGIGLAVARAYVAAGARAVICGRNPVTGLAAETSLRANGGLAKFVRADAGDEQDIRALIAVAVAEFGAVDIVVNNAGPNGAEIAMGLVHELDTETFDRAMKIGAYGPFWMAKYALPHMMAAKRGVFVNMSSLSVERAIARFSVYAMGKSAMDALGRQIANDYAAYNIRSNSILVGTVRPSAGDVSTLPAGLDLGETDAIIAKTTMMGRLGEYDDVAKAAVFLASDDSRYVTGAAIPVDGGARARVQYPEYRKVV